MNPSFENPKPDPDQTLDNSPDLTANPDYALGRIAAATTTSQEHADPETRVRAQTKISDWLQVYAGMLSGNLRVGSRTPVWQTPAWATLEIVQGGFATGTLLAEGPLQPHEERLLSQIGTEIPYVASALSARRRINHHYLSEAGMIELQEMLQTGCYRIDVPEEGALLVVAWLLKQDQEDAAHRLLETIAPYLDRLRFYPIPSENSVPEDGVAVHLQEVKQVVQSLEKVRPPLAVLKQRESDLVWAPLSDRFVALFLETVEGPTPFVRVDPNGESVVDGGYPCQYYSADWRTQAQNLIEEYKRLRAQHTLCAKPDRAGTNFAILRSALETCIANPTQLTGREVGCVRAVLARIIARRGTPSSEQYRELRREQEQRSNRPTSAELAQVLIRRLAAYSPEGGLERDEIVEVFQPVTGMEALQLRVPVGERFARTRFGMQVARCLSEPPEELVEIGVLTSSEALAKVMPQITAVVSASAFENADLRKLYIAIYRAFRRRRSLLLLNLEHQVRFSELPWVEAVTVFQGKGEAVREQARYTLAQMATLAVTSFPQQILPNKLLQEFQTLAKTAELTDNGLPVPVVEEVAADIFMGAFSPKYLYAAKSAGRLLEGTLYERYYGLSYARVREINDVPLPQPAPKKPQPYASAPTSPAFYQLCRELAVRERGTATEISGSYVAKNGTIIEQEQILTTHNLAVLFTAANLGETISPRHRNELARRCFAWICHRHLQTPSGWKARLQLIKNSAYAWRQMVFFLALGSDDDAHAFMVWATEHLEEQPEALRERFRPAIAGLERAVQGLPIGSETAESYPRFLGWTTGKHWLLP